MGVVVVVVVAAAVVVVVVVVVTLLNWIHATKRHKFSPKVIHTLFNVFFYS